MWTLNMIGLYQEKQNIKTFEIIHVLSPNCLNISGLTHSIKCKNFQTISPEVFEFKETNILFFSMHPNPIILKY